MSDDLGLRGADAPRALPAASRARLEEVLRSGSWRKQEHRLVRAIEFEALFEGIDGPRPVPPGSRARLTRTMQPRRSALAQRALAIAAVLLLLASTGVIVFRPDGTRAPDVADAPVPLAPQAIPAPPPAAGQAGSETTDDQAGLASGPALVLPSPEQAGPAPPYAFDSAAMADTAPAYGAGSAPAPGATPQPVPAPPPALRIGVVRGEAEIEAGFKRYIAILNDGGGVRRRQVHLLTVSPQDPAPASVVATINLSADAIAGDEAPSWTRGPLLETLAATQAVQHGRVRSFASPPERQGHLIADQMYPMPVDGPTTAVIYHETDALFGDLIPDAIATALEARGVTALRIEYDPKNTSLLVPADAAFLSLRTRNAERWLIDSDQAGYHPPRGIGGIYTLMEPRLGQLMEGRNVHIVSPYARPSGPEVEALAGAGGSYNDARAHGWLTAKSLAVAVWLHGGSDAAGVRRALARLTGYRTGFTPPYEVRGRSNARTPEGMLFSYEGARFVARSEFLRDPF